MHGPLKLTPGPLIRFRWTQFFMLYPMMYAAQNFFFIVNSLTWSTRVYTTPNLADSSAPPHHSTSHNYRLRISLADIFDLEFEEQFHISNPDMPTKRTRMSILLGLELLLNSGFWSLPHQIGNMLLKSRPEIRRKNLRNISTKPSGGESPSQPKIEKTRTPVLRSKGLRAGTHVQSKVFRWQPPTVDHSNVHMAPLLLI